MMDTRKLYEVREELSREHGTLIQSASRDESATDEVAMGNPGEVELVRLGLIQEALRALELVLQNYSQETAAPVAETRGLGLDVARFHYPAPEEVNVVLVAESTLLKAEDLMTGCEACTEEAELTFEYLLDALSGCDSTTTEYLLRRPAKCPRCFAPVTEKTPVFYG